ncbi:thiamine phosphate synthase [Halovulum sp. GXIMD14793]
MDVRPDSLRLYLVTDPGLCPGPALLDTVAAAVRGGVSFVQLRDKNVSTQARVEAARALKQCLKDTGVPLVINDDLEAAIAADVDGVHIGQDDVGPVEARARLGPDRIIGLSCDSTAQVLAADPKVIDYLGLGTVFPTATKTDHKPTIGLSGLAEMARLSKLPSVAIGGLKAKHAAAVLKAGCDGIAVVSAICGQTAPEEAARSMIQALNGNRDINQ